MHWRDQEIMVLALLTVFLEMEKLLCCGIHEMDVFQCRLRLMRSGPLPQVDLLT